MYIIRSNELRTPGNGQRDSYVFSISGGQYIKAAAFLALAGFVCGVLAHLSVVIRHDTFGAMLFGTSALFCGVCVLCFLRNACAVWARQGMFYWGRK